MLKRILLIAMVLTFLTSAGSSQTLKTIDYTTATPTEVLKTVDPSKTPWLAVIEAIEGIGTYEASGTMVVIGTPPNINRTDVSSVATDTETWVTPLVNRKSISLFNHSDSCILWVSLDADAASATVGLCTPVGPFGAISLELDDSINVSFIASEVFDITVYQDGY